MRRVESKRITSKMPVVAISKNYKNYSQAGADVTAVLDTDEDRVMLYHNHSDKQDNGLLKRSRREYHA